MRVLIVEDELMIAHDLREALTDAGFEVVGVAADGSEARATAAAHDPEVVLMDVRLRGGDDGVQVATELLDDHAVPFVFLTAHSDEATVRRVQEVGAAMLIKPFDEQELVAAVRVAVRRHRDTLRLQRQRAHLAADLGHRLNSPLSTALGNTRWLATHLARLRQQGGSAHDWDAVMGAIDDVAGAIERIHELSRELRALDDPSP